MSKIQSVKRPPVTLSERAMRDVDEIVTNRYNPEWMKSLNPNMVACPYLYGFFCGHNICPRLLKEG